MAKKGTRLNPKQELFCRYYSRGSTFGNATLSYVMAYGLKNIYHKNGKIDVLSSHYQTANTNGPELLVKTGILEHCAELINEWVNDGVVDSELAKVILQNEHLSPKVAAISEFNKVHGRITSKVKHKFEGVDTDSLKQRLAEIIAGGDGDSDGD